MDPVNNGAPQQNSAPQQQPMDPASKNTLMGVLSYLGPLVLVPFLTSKDQPFVKFHIKQGLVVLSIEIIVWILGMALPWQWTLFMLLRLVNLGTLILSIIGIVNVVEKREKELPLVGSFSKYFTF